MDSYIRDYIFEIKTLSPVFIGSGESIGKKEYLYDRPRNTVKIPDMKKLYNGLLKLNKLKVYENYLLRENKDLFFFFKDNNIPPKEYNSWFCYSADMADSRLSTRTSKEIFTFIKDPYGNPYVPGSSLKGALRTILQSDWYLNHEKEAKRIAARIKHAEPASRNRYLSAEDRKMDVESMHRMRYSEAKLEDQNNDILRGLIVGDSHPLAKNQMCIAQKIDLSVNGITKEMNLLRECIKPGTVIRFPISIDTTVCKYTARMIVDAIKYFYGNYQVEFMDHFINAPTVRGAQTIFFLGGGAGYVSKTCTYAVLHGKEGQKTVGKILNETLPQRGPARRQHNHLKDAEKGASPHTLKCTRYNGELVQMGACGLIKFKRQEKKK